MDYKTALTGYRLTHDDVVNMRIAGHIRDETGMTMCDHCYTGIKNIVLVSGNLISNFLLNQFEIIES